MNLPVIDSGNPPLSASAVDPRRHLLDLSQEDLKQWLIDHGQPGFRAKQIIHWVFQRRVSDFQEMSDLPKALRTQLAESFRVYVTTPSKIVQSTDGTDKVLVGLPDACW